MSVQDFLTEEREEELQDRFLEIYHSVLEEWMSDDENYARIMQLANNEELSACVMLKPELTPGRWDDSGFLPEELEENQAVELSLFYMAPADVEAGRDPEEIIVSALLSADPSNTDFCVLQWFPEV